LQYHILTNHVGIQVGFEMIDAIAEAEGIPVSSKQFKAIVGKGNSVHSILIYMCISLT
jgi:hypothetical protein